MRRIDPDIEQRDYAKQKLTEAEVLDLVDKAGSVAAVLSTRNAVVKERGWAEKPPSAKVFAKAAAEDNNLLKRPIVVVGKRVIVGKDEAAWRDALGSG